LSNPILFSVGEASSMLGVSRAKFYQLLQAGTIRCLKIGSSSRIPQAEIDRYIRELSIDQHGVDITVIDGEGGQR
jgi:excisionase family DNA binding protein